MSQPSITQQVIKYCQMGFFPICKLQNGKYKVFAPFKDEYGFTLCSCIYPRLEGTKKPVFEIHTDLVDTDFDLEAQPTEIIGFYHPPFKPFEVGDRVKTMVSLLYYTSMDKDKNMFYPSDKLGKIIEVIRHPYNPDIPVCYKVEYDNGLTYKHSHSELEPYLEQTPQETIKDGQAIQIGEDTFEITPELITVLKNLKKLN